MAKVIEVKRLWKKQGYTIGKMYVDGEYVADTLEDTDRGLRQDMLKSDIVRLKIPAETAIPSGEYDVDLDVVSPRFGKMPFYKEVCGGKLPRLKDVPGFEGVLIHVGSNALHTEGCILLGKNQIVGGLTKGKECFKLLWEKIKGSKNLRIKIG